jgi:hypothetical protein
MHTLNGRLRTIVCVLALLVSSSFSQNQAGGSASDWKTVVQSRLPLYGHRNWIVVADSAFPVYAAPGIETIVVSEDLPAVLKYVAGAISKSRHVRATVFLDQELQFIDERDYPGVSELRKQITVPFSKDQVSSIPHTDRDEQNRRGRERHSESCSSRPQKRSRTPRFTCVWIVAI